MVEKLFNEGEIIFRQGEIGKCFYQIEEGAVGIFVNYDSDDPEKLTDLRRGSYFGELAVIECYPRSDTAVALADNTKVTEISSGELNEYLEGDPDKALALMNYIGKRLRELTDDYNEAEELLDELRIKVKKDESDGFFKKIRKFSKFFGGKEKVEKSVEEQIREKGLEGYSAKTEIFPRGTIIFKEGESGNCMYGIHWGRVGIFLNYGEEDETLLTYLYTNDFFGEMGLVSGQPRSATAVVLEPDTVVEIIEEKDLKELFEKNPPKASMIIAHLSHRLRRLTDDYMEDCKLLHEITQ